MTGPSDAAVWPIREISRRTGVNPVTLRAWERRYGLLRPLRDSKGHRLYTQAHLQRINDILHWLDRGVPVSRVRALLEESQSPPVHEDGPWDEPLRLGFRALADSNLRRLESMLNELLALYPPDQVIRHWAEGIRDGLRHRSGEARARAEMRLFESFLLQKLSVRLLNRAPRRRDQAVLVVPMAPSMALDVVLTALPLVSVSPLLVITEPLDREALFSLSLDERLRAAVACVPVGMSVTALNRHLGRQPVRAGLPLLLAGPGLRSLDADRLKHPRLADGGNPGNALSALLEEGT